MGSQFWWFYDILAVALTLFIIYLNAKRGFKKNFLIIIGYVLSVVVTSVTSAMLAEPVYTGLIRESNLYAFDQVLSDYDGTAVIQNALDKQEYGAKFDEKKIDIYLSPAKADFEDELYRYVNQTCDYTVTTHGCLWRISWRTTIRCMWKPCSISMGKPARCGRSQPIWRTPM